MTTNAWKSEAGYQMPWYYILLLVCVVIAPFDALYMYIKSERHREELRRRDSEAKEEEDDTPTSE